MSHVTYLFDPLCGWRYGAAPALAALRAAPGSVGEGEERSPLRADAVFRGLPPLLATLGPD
ncbi:hypothetical protein [Methylobacterium sp. ID0610]|uniref:hypothetical protein n=1 Tax=Methylobacterium carpenticola TaxID=3344827 RepID=UPI0036D02A17